MASHASSKTLKSKGEAHGMDNCFEVTVGAKVARFFSSHQLPLGQHPQWIHGKVSGFKLTGKKGTKSNTTWWTLSFEPPATKPLSCNTEEVVLMLQAAQEFRLKIHTLEKNVGNNMLVMWTEEDSDLSLTEWGNDLRMCMLFKYITSTKQFVLRFKCGFDKIVDANTAVQLFQDSDALYASNKVKTKRSVAIAKKEWDINGDNEAETRIVMDVASSSKVQDVQESIRKALAQKLAEKIAREGKQNGLFTRLKLNEPRHITYKERMSYASKRKRQPL
jgi:hypothetical protein